MVAWRYGCHLSALQCELSNTHHCHGSPTQLHGCPPTQIVQGQKNTFRFICGSSAVRLRFVCGSSTVFNAHHCHRSPTQPHRCPPAQIVQGQTNSLMFVYGLSMVSNAHHYHGSPTQLHGCLPAQIVQGQTILSSLLVVRLQFIYGI